MKKILLSLLILFSFSEAKKINYCSINLINFMTDKNTIAEFNDFKRKNQIDYQNLGTIESNRLLKLSEKINYETPYKESVALEFIKLIKPQKEKYVNNKSYIKLMLNLGIFALSPKVKLELHNMFIEDINNDFKLKNYFLNNKTYKKYLFLENLYILPKKELKIYKSKIPENSKEIEFRILDLIQNGEDKYNKNIFMDHGEINLKYKRAILKKIRETCSSKSLIADSNKRYKISYFIRLFYLSKLFPDIKTEIKEYYFAISTNTSIWELLEYFYSLRNKNYKDASFALNIFYEKEGKPEYLLSHLSFVNYKRAEESFKIGKIYETWDKSLETLNNLIKLQDKKNGLNKYDFKVSQKTKELLKGSGQDLIVNFANKNDIKVAKYIQKETIEKIKFIFKRNLYTDKNIKYINLN